MADDSRVEGDSRPSQTFIMNRKLTLLLLSLCSYLLSALPLMAQDPEGDEELDWMLDHLHLASEQLETDPETLFSALAHGLSIAEVAIAEDARPADLLEHALTYEDSLILDLLLEGEIDREEAIAWREETAVDMAWLLHEEDPFGLQEIVHLLDAASFTLDLGLHEVVEWMAEGYSLNQIALEMETDPMELADLATELLEEELSMLILLEQIEEEDAEDWRAWSAEMLPEMLEDEDLLETLAEEMWMEEIVEIFAEVLETDADDLWMRMEDGNDLSGILDDSDFDAESMAEEFGMEAAEMLEMAAEFDAWINEDDMAMEDEADRAEF